MKLPNCSWCGKAIVKGTKIVGKRDAANVLHVFHAKCWKKHREFWKKR